MQWNFRQLPTSKPLSDKQLQQPHPPPLQRSTLAGRGHPWGTCLLRVYPSLTPHQSPPNAYGHLPLCLEMRPQSRSTELWFWAAEITLGRDGSLNSCPSKTHINQPSLALNPQVSCVWLRGPVKTQLSEVSANTRTSSTAPWGVPKWGAQRTGSTPGSGDRP